MKAIRTLIYFVFAVSWIWLGFAVSQYGWFSLYFIYVVVTILGIGWITLLEVQKL